MDDNPDGPNDPKADNVIPFERAQSLRRTHPSYSSNHDDDELLKGANDKIAEWQANSNLPSLTQVQELFYGLISAGASAMARDKIVSAIIAAFGDQLGGKRALTSTWSELARQCAAERAQFARDKRANKTPAPLTLAEKRAQFFEMRRDERLAVAPGHQRELGRHDPAAPRPQRASERSDTRRQGRDRRCTAARTPIGSARMQEIVLQIDQHEADTRQIINARRHAARPSALFPMHTWSLPASW